MHRKGNKKINGAGIAIGFYIIVSLLVIAVLSIVVASRTDNGENYKQERVKSHNDNVGVPPWGNSLCNCFGAQFDGSSGMPDGPHVGAYCGNYEKIGHFYENSQEIENDWSCVA